MDKRGNFADGLERRARRAIFWHAIMRWESAVIIALTLVVAALLGMAALVGLAPQWWALAALGVGLALEAIIFVSSVTDEKENARIVAAMLRDEYSPKRLQTRQLQVQLNKALEYRGLIANTVRRTNEGVLRDRLGRATEPVDDWIEAINRLAIRLDGYYLNRVIQQDLRAVPREIQEFRRRLAKEDSAVVKETLSNTIADKERQFEQLNKLQNTMQKAEYQLESTLAALGTVYAQLQTIDIRGAEKGRADRLRQDIDEQVAQLQDLSEAMDEVYQAGS